MITVYSVKLICELKKVPRTNIPLYGRSLKDFRLAINQKYIRSERVFFTDMIDAAIKSLRSRHSNRLGTCLE